MTITQRIKSSSHVYWNEQELCELLASELASILSLDRTMIDPSKTFDEYGLDSTDAVVVVGLVEERLGIDLPPELLLQNRTIDEVIRAIVRPEQSAESVGRPEDDNLVFLVAGCGGRDQTGLVRLRARCTPVLRFELLRLGDWRDWVEHDLTFGDLVARAVSQIEARVPEGPLRLSGYSQGGQLAYAAALALSHAGRAVHFLGLLDTQYGPGTMRSIGQPKVVTSITASFIAGAIDFATRAYRYIKRNLGGANGPPRPALHQDLVFKLWRSWRRLPGSRALLRFIARHGGMLFRGPGGVHLDITFQMHVFFMMWQAWCEEANLEPPMQSPVFLFRTTDPGEPDLGWAECCANLKIIPVSGGHLTLFDPEHLDNLATQFTAAMQQTAEANTRLP